MNEITHARSGPLIRLREVTISPPAEFVPAGLLPEALAIDEIDEPRREYLILPGVLESSHWAKFDTGQNPGDKRLRHRYILRCKRMISIGSVKW